LAQSHPHLTRILHVILNAVPDAVPLFLGLAGLVYLMPNLAKRIEDSKPIRVGLATLCILFMFLAIAVNAINREAQDHEASQQNTTMTELGNKITFVQGQNVQLSSFLIGAKGTINEADRRKGIENVLRNEFILSQNAIDPQILAGNEYPPAAWMNKRLNEMGEHWDFKDPPKHTSQEVVEQVYPEKKKTEMAFSFYQKNMDAEHFQTSSEVPLVDNQFKFSIAGVVTGSEPAEGLNIWVRGCDGCTWKSAPPMFQSIDQSTPFDERTGVPEMLPNVSTGKWDFTIELPIFPKGINSLPISVYYACTNCAPVDWKKPQILWLVAPKIFKLHSTATFYTPGLVRQ
jgi:hypothetical protein